MPTNIKPPNLEGPCQGKRPDLLLPAGVTNVALRKPVTASNASPITGGLSQVTEGDKDGAEWTQFEVHGKKLAVP